MKKIRTRNQQKRLLSKLKQEQLINSYVKEQRERVDSEEHLGVKKPKPTSFLLTVLSFPFIVLLMLPLSLVLSFIILVLAIIDLFKFNK